jgi:hypothetical protein
MPARPHNFAPALYGIVMSATPLLIGCAVAHYNSAVPVEHPAFSGVIAVLWEMPPAGSYEELGRMEVEGSAFADEAVMIETAKVQAGNRGANAVVITRGRVDRWSLQAGRVIDLHALAIRRRR